MGQGQSQQGPPPSIGTVQPTTTSYILNSSLYLRMPQLTPRAAQIEELSARLTQTFATKCYTPLELYSFKHVFRSLAEDTSGIRYWSESTLCRFLELPDALTVGPVIFQLASYLGAFPFPSQAPAILTNEALLRAVTVLTGRWVRCLKSGKGGREKVLWRREVWRGLAVFDRGVGSGGSPVVEKRREEGSASQGFAIDRAVEAEDEEDEDEDGGLAFEAFEMMDAAEAFKVGEKSTVQHAMIPSDNLLRLVQLLLLAAPLGPQDSLAILTTQLSEQKLARLREVAGYMLASFGGIEQTPGVGYRTFEKVLAGSMPFLLDSIQPLFEHFLFAKDMDLHKRKGSTSHSIPAPPLAQEIPKALSSQEPLLEKEGDILDLPMLHQLASFLGGSTLYRRIRMLYSGNTHGFSMGQFEKSCFKWQAPSILLVSGTLLNPSSHNSRETSFLDSLPYRRFSSSTTGQRQRLVYGAYIPVPWKSTPKTAFGTVESKLFQLSPVHDVFGASTLDPSYIYFCKPPSSRTGLGFGSRLPSQSTHNYTGTSTLPLGPVSLHIDDTLTYASFTHSSDGGGAFHPSNLPRRRKEDWQDRFEIDAIEVWGCGGSEVAEEQRRAWAWEEREAEARRRINLGTGDLEADRELLRMVGLVGGGGRDSGGSMT